MGDLASIIAIAARVRTNLVADASERGKNPTTLRGDCAEASCRLHDAFEAAHIPSTICYEHFRVDNPDPRSRLRKGRTVGHHERCFLWPHAWVETGRLIIDLTAMQFAEMCNAGAAKGFDAITIRDLAEEATAKRWIREYPRINGD